MKRLDLKLFSQTNKIGLAPINDVSRFGLAVSTPCIRVGTACMHCGSEHRKTEQVFSYPSIATSKYS